LPIINTCYGDYLPPLVTIQGALISNSVIAYIARKNLPIYQWSFFECSNIVDNLLDNPVKIIHDMYDTISRLNVLQIGCGATGNESAKLLNWMGVGKRGKLILCDYDKFVLSNRNRQFLCLSDTINQPKCEVATSTLKKWFPDHDITSLNLEFSDYSLSKYDENFIKQLDIIIPTVDNVKARKFTSQICEYYSKYMLECGTDILNLSTFCYKPRDTMLYDSNEDEEINEVEEFNCNPRVYCFRDIHTIQYSVDSFNNWFNNYLFFETKKDINPIESERIKIDAFIKALDGDVTEMMNIIFKEEYHDKILELLESNKEEDFWIGLKKCPHPISFNQDLESHQQFKIAIQHLFEDIKKKRH